MNGIPDWLESEAQRIKAARRLAFAEGVLFSGVVVVWTVIIIRAIMGL